jgi:hypothetical protein
MIEAVVKKAFILHGKERKVGSIVTKFELDRLWEPFLKLGRIERVNSEPLFNDAEEE